MSEITRQSQNLSKTLVNKRRMISGAKPPSGVLIYLAQMVDHSSRLPLNRYYFSSIMPKTMPSTRNLIRDPFGPYPEHQILNSQFGKKGCLDLNSVSMECAGSPIGSVQWNTPQFQDFHLHLSAWTILNFSSVGAKERGQDTITSTSTADLKYNHLTGFPTRAGVGWNWICVNEIEK